MNFIMDEINHNLKVRKNINAIHNDIKKCTSADDVISTLEKYPEDQQLIYKSNLLPTLIKISIALLVLKIISIFLFNTSPMPGIILIATILITITYKIACIWLKDSYDTLIPFIETVYLEKKYGFEQDKEQENISHKKILKSFKSLFKKGNDQDKIIFSKGGNLNKIVYFASGKLSYDQQEFPYTIFQYNYIHRKEFKETNNYKREETTTVYNTHYKRWGIFISGIEHPSFAITNHYDRYFPRIWKTSSLDFNEKYCISSEHDSDLTQFIEPANIYILEQLYENYSSSAIVHKKSIQTLCWNFDRNILKHANKNPNDCINTKQLSSHVAGLYIPEYERLMRDTKHLLNILVK